MNLRLVTVQFDPEVGAFPEDPLAAIEGEVVSAVEHFFHHQGLPHLLLVVHVREPLVPAGARRGAPASTQARDGGSARATLTADERSLYDLLVAWRNAAAQVEGVPPYVIATNRQMAEIARHRPASATALRTVYGFGDAKIRKYGDALLALVLAEHVPVGGAVSAAPEGGSDGP